MESKPYKPRRDYRFEYIHEAMAWLEDRQCTDCFFAEPGEYPMCSEVASYFLEEIPVEPVDDKGEDGLYCTKYRNVIVAEQEHPDQGRLL